MMQDDSDFLDPFDLQRFIEAQSPCIDQVMDELRAGKKQSHWMWFIFPQLSGLGRSEKAEFCALHSVQETQAYGDHNLLRDRLISCTLTTLEHPDSSAESIFGYPDHLKFHSSMTLFHLVFPQAIVFKAALDTFWDGQLDNKTVNLLSGLES